MELLKKIDSGWARVEGWLTVSVLLIMVLVAGWQAFVRNLTRFDIQWANELLTDLEWADSFLRKGTMWLAFLGASLATRAGKHIGIDVLTRMAPPKAKYSMMAMAALCAGVITLGLTYSFSSAVHLNLTERPIEYELLGEDGSIHACDASDEEIAILEDFEKPAIFCAFRSMLGAVGVPAETPGAAFQLIVPIMFAAIAIRLLAHGIGYIMVLTGGPESIARAIEKERKEIEAQAVVMSQGLVPADGPGSPDASPASEPEPSGVDDDPGGDADAEGDADSDGEEGKS